jgi:hypothetical protein
VIDAVFDACVYSLFILADGLGMSCEAMNVWISCVIWPALTLALVALVIGQRAKIRRLRRLVKLGERNGAC